MHTNPTLARPARRDVGTALGIYFVTIVLSTWAAQKPVTTGGALLSSAVVAAGTLAIGLLLARRSAYPRRFFLGATAILSVAALVGPLLIPDPAAWRVDGRPLIWMHPWLLMVLGWLPPGSARSWCAPAAKFSGWILIGTATILALLSYVPSWVSPR